jgi:ATP-binding cassette subfamily B protein
VLAGANGVPSDQSVATLIGILVSLAGLYFIIWIVWRINEFTNAAFEVGIMRGLVNRAFQNLIFHSYSFFSGSFTGSLVRRVTRLPRAFENFKDIALYNVLPTIVVLIGIPFILAARSILLGIGFLIFSIALIAFHIGIANWKQKYNVDAAEKDTELTGAISDSVSNEYTVKLFAGEHSEIGRVHEASKSLAKTRFVSYTIDNIINLFQGGFMMVTELVLMYVTIRLWRQGLATIGDFALVQAYLISASNQLWGFNRTVRGMYESIADATEIVDIMETPHEVRDIPSATELVVTDASIDFNEVIFAFNETNTILDDFSLHIKGGERLALVGPSGAGKSTIVKLLLRLHDVTGGAIKIDGMNIKDVTQSSLRGAIGFVPQEPILFHRTLLDNIRYGRPDATDEEVMTAAKEAHCHEFISHFPEGYETYVGERGVKLSGGERQRVAIARAILKNAPILILDEATSSLDSESEQLIQDALQLLMKGKTVIVIAHRLSTIMSMDRIVVIESGKVIDSGTHNELLKKDGLYKKLWSIQAGGFIGEE